MWPFRKKSWIWKAMDKLHSGGSAPMISWATSKFLVGLGIGMLLATYFPDAPRDGWAMWGWAFILLALVTCIPAFKAMLNKN